MGGYGGAVLQGRKFQRASARLELPGTGYLLRSRASPLSLDRYEGRIRYRPVSRRVAPRTHEGTGRFLERLVASMAPMTERRASRGTTRPKRVYFSITLRHVFGLVKLMRYFIV